MVQELRRLNRAFGGKSGLFFNYATRDLPKLQKILAGVRPTECIDLKFFRGVLVPLDLLKNNFGAVWRISFEVHGSLSFKKTKKMQKYIVCVARTYVAYAYACVAQNKIHK